MLRNIMSHNNFLYETNQIHETALEVYIHLKILSIL